MAWPTLTLYAATRLRSIEHGPIRIELGVDKRAIGCVFVEVPDSMSYTQDPTHPGRGMERLPLAEAPRGGEGDGNSR